MRRIKYKLGTTLHERALSNGPVGVADRDSGIEYAIRDVLRIAREVEK